MAQSQPGELKSPPITMTTFLDVDARWAVFVCQTGFIVSMGTVVGTHQETVSALYLYFDPYDLTIHGIGSSKQTSSSVTAMTTPPPSLFLSFRKTWMFRGKISELVIEGSNHVSVPIMMSGLVF